MTRFNLFVIVRKLVFYSLLGALSWVFLLLGLYASTVALLVAYAFLVAI